MAHESTGESDADACDHRPAQRHPAAGGVGGLDDPPGRRPAVEEGSAGVGVMVGGRPSGHGILIVPSTMPDAPLTGPRTYLRSVLAKIATTPMSELDQFLPEKWKAEDAQRT